MRDVLEDGEFSAQNLHPERGKHITVDMFFYVALELAI